MNQTGYLVLTFQFSPFTTQPCALNTHNPVFAAIGSKQYLPLL